MNDMKAPSISVIGKGTTTAPADVGFVDLYVRTDGMLLEDAVLESTRKCERIVEAIKAAAPNVRKIEVTDVQIGETKPSWRETNESPKPEVVKNVLVVISPAPDAAVRIVDVASRLGATLQNPLSNSPFGDPLGVIVYGLLSCGSVEEEVMKKAVDNASENASRMAKLMEKSLGRILNVSKVEWFSGSVKSVFEKNVNCKFQTDYLSVTPENVVVTASLTVDFELRD
jgi:uncharacterized protein YggE